MTPSRRAIKHALLTGASALIVAGCPALPAMAQAQSLSATDAGSGASDIIVTAQRREQRLQDVPLSVTALSGKSLHDQGAVTFQDYAGSIPSLSYEYVGPTGYRGERDYAIRGIYGTNTVGFYIDETPVPIIDPQLLDVARVEVLRGPQATLYGSNSMGGTIKFIMNKPEFNIFSGSAEGDVSTTAGGGVNNKEDIILNIPLVNDKLAARLSYSHRDDSGFIDNYYDGYPGLALRYVPTTQQNHGVAKNWNAAHANTARLALRYEPVDGLTITPTVAYAKTSLDNAPTFFGSLPGTKVVRSLRTPESEETELASLNVRYATDHIEIVDNVSYFHKVNTAVEDATQIGFGYLPPSPYSLRTHIVDNYIYNEIHIQSTFAGPFNFLVGGIYGNDHNDNDQFSAAPGLSANNPTLPPIPDDLIIAGGANHRTIEKSLYAEARLDLPAHFQITGGFRYYSFDVHNIDGSLGFAGSGGFTDNRSKESGARPRLTLSWIPSSHFTLFSNYGKGFRPGFPGTAQAAICGGGRTPTVVSDTVTNYEVGAKANLLRGRLQFSGTVYRMDWKGVQQQILLPCGYLQTQNTGDARSQGVEFEFNAKPTTFLSLSGSATYTDAKITDAQIGAPATAGAPILFVPAWKLNFGAQVERPLVSDWRGYARVDLNYESKVLIDYALNYGRKGYGTVNARIGADHGGWKIEIYGENLSNTLPITNLYTFALPDNVYLNSTIRPRTVGLRVSIDFRS